MFESVLEWIDRELSSSLKNGAYFKDPDGKLDGTVLFFDGEIKDGKGVLAGKRLFAYYLSTSSNDKRLLNPAFIWDLVPSDKTFTETIDIDTLKTIVLPEIISTIELYRDELSHERDRQANIKEKYGVRSLEYLILKLDRDLIDLYSRRDRGENVDLAMRNKEDQKKRYEVALGELKKNIKHEKILTMSTPNLIGAIRVIPMQNTDPAMKSDAEIERIGMKVSMEHEIKQNRTPEDVSSENLGFDIRSTDIDGNIRYIEVKARANWASISITQNEWFKANRFQDDYYLYAVMNASSQPELRIIRNPAVILEPKRIIELVRYIVSPDQIKREGEFA